MKKYNIFSKLISSKVELFDVVDVFDRVTGIAPRTFIHCNKLFHRAVHVFVFNKDGKLFLQRRSLNKDLAPGKWVSSCSGHVDSGEYYYDAAKRELGEEIGLYSPENLRLLKIEMPRPETGYEHVHLFSCRSEGPFKLNVLEIQEGMWISRRELALWIKKNPQDFSWSFIFLWSKYNAINHL